MDFAGKVYRVVKRIPEGRVSSYGAVARAAGFPKAYRAVGNVLNRNPFAPHVPCHRVVKSNGFVGGFARGRKEKIRLLREEGVVVENDRIVDFSKVFYGFS